MYAVKTAIVLVLAIGGNGVGRVQPYRSRGAAAVCYVAFGRINAVGLLAFATSVGHGRCVHGG